MALSIRAVVVAVGVAACGKDPSPGRDMAASTGDLASQDAADMATTMPPQLTVPSQCNTAPSETAANLITLVQAKCYGGTCHNSGILPSMRSMTDLLGLKGLNSTAALPYVTASDVNKSYLLYKLTGEQLKVTGGSGSQMPMTGSLSTTELCRFYSWVKNGAN